MKEHLKILRGGVAAWNKWRARNPGIKPNLSRANLNGAVLIKANLRGANLSKVSLRNADLQEADLSHAFLGRADLKGANLTRAHLKGAYLGHTNLAEGNLTAANLKFATLVKTNLEGATIVDCLIYGIATWGLTLKNTTQSNLIITRGHEPSIFVDNLEIAQFVYLLLNNERIRDIIDSLTAKIVLILGRFTPERKLTLDHIRQALRESNYLPIIFDWDRPLSRDFIETVSTLAHLSKFVIADVTDSKIVLEELPHIVRNLAVPIVPLMLEGAGDEPVTLYNLRINHRSILNTYYYKDTGELLLFLEEKVIAPAAIKSDELNALRVRSR